MNTAHKLLLLGGAGTEAAEQSFTDLFDREDGALGSDYISADSYSISDYKAVATPTLGSELANNPGFEGTYTDGIAPDWSITGGTATEQTGTVHSGSSAQQFVGSNDRLYQPVPTTPGKWYRAEIWMYSPDSSGTNCRFRVGNSHGTAAHGSVSLPSQGAWHKLAVNFRATATSAFLNIWILNAATVYVDDASMKEITPASMYGLYQPGQETFSVRSVQALSATDIGRAGIALRMSADLQNGVRVTVNKDTNAILSTKIVSGTETQLFSDSVTINNKRVLRVTDDGDQTVKIYYAGTLVRTLTITDVPADAGNYVGLFTSSPATTFSGFVVAEQDATPTIPRYVSKSGNDSNPGSVALPTLTIGAAQTLAANNDLITEVDVAAGTYTEAVVCSVANLTFTGQSGAIVDGDGSNHGFHTNNVNGITITGFTVQNTGSNHGVYLQSADDCTVSDCIFDTVNHGVLAYSGSLNVLISNCEATGHTARGFGLVLGAKGIIEDCYAHDPAVGTAYGFEVEQVSGAENLSIVRRCWATGGTHGFIAKTGTGVRFENCVAFSVGTSAFYWKGAPNCSATHCVAFGSSEGFALRDDSGSAPASTGVALHNNIVLDCTTGIVAEDGSESNLASDFNDYFGCTHIGAIETTDYDTLAAWQSASGGDANSLTLDPDYASEAYEGFLLPTGSPMLTAGSDGGPMGREGEEVTAISMTLTTTAPAQTKTISQVTTTASDVEVDWGDGNTTTLSSGLNSNVAHEYALAGTYTIRIQNSLETVTNLRPSSMGLTAIAIPYTLTALVTLVLGVNQLSNILIPNTLTALEDLHLFSNQLPSVLIPNALTALEVVRLEGNEMDTDAVDAVIDGIYANRANYTFAGGIVLQVHNNAPPTGTYQDVCPPTTTLERAYQLVNDNCLESINLWTVQYDAA